MPTLLVTGASRGIGLEFVRQYLAEGWQVFAGARNPDGARELQTLASGSAGRVKLIRMDVADTASIKAAAASVGDEAIDILINNAGVSGGSHQTIADMDYAVWAEVFNVNTMGALRVTEAFVGNLGRSDGKLLVALTSGMGSITDNRSGGSIAYRTSKAALNMLMRTLAVDLAPSGITSIVINPGWVRTRMGGAGAHTSVDASVRAMRKVLDDVRLEQSGKFFNWDGREYSW